MNRANVLLLCLGLVLTPGLSGAQDSLYEAEERLAGQRELESPENPAAASRSPFALAVKMGWHWFFEEGVFVYSSHPYYGVSSCDLQGPNGEVEVDYFFREWVVFTVTAGGYGASLSRYKQDYVVGYALLSAKILRPGRLMDYYAGAGVGAYLARVSNDVDTAYALQPGLHALLGIRFHVTPAWSIFLEDRVAFTLKAQGLFHSLDLGGNHLFTGASYRF